ncbi:MAG: OsmC family protein [Candidatus Cyclobacteriaceae bacterium M2_1C_046]
MIITTEFIEDELFQSRNDQNIMATIDMRPVEKKSNMSPMELLLSALSSCIAVEVVSMIKKRRKTVKNLVITSEGDRNPVPPRYFTDIRIHFKLISPDANNDELEKATRLAVEKYCSVGSSLRSSITFSTEVELP